MLVSYHIAGSLVISSCHQLCSRRDLHDLPRNDGYDIAKAFGLTCQFLVNTQPTQRGHSFEPMRTDAAGAPLPILPDLSWDGAQVAGLGGLGCFCFMDSKPLDFWWANRADIIFLTSDPPQRQKTTRYKQIQTLAIPLYVAVKGATSGWGLDFLEKSPTLQRVNSTKWPKWSNRDRVSWKFSADQNGLGSAMPGSMKALVNFFESLAQLHGEVLVRNQWNLKPSSRIIASFHTFTSSFPFKFSTYRTNPKKSMAVKMTSPPTGPPCE